MDGRGVEGDTSSVLPWTRLDKYGELGFAPQPFAERARQLFMAITLLPLKSFGALLCLLSYFIVIKASFLFPRSVRSEWIANLGKIHCRACLFCIGFMRVKWIKVPENYYGNSNSPSDVAYPKPGGIVSNHCGWADILVHMSHSFPSFVARDATERTPIIGSISKAMGCLFVDRSKRAMVNSSEGVACRVKQRMIDTAAGNPPHARPLLLFPEGTTTNGVFMLPFKTGAFLAGVPLQPVIIQYHTNRVSPSWEAIPIKQHIFLLFCDPIHSVTCYELPVYVPSPEEIADPRLYADNVRRKMMQFSGLRDTDLTYEDKMINLNNLRKKYGLPVPQHTAQNGAEGKSD